MTLPLIHPEKVLGIRRKNQTLEKWSQVGIYGLKKFIFKNIAVTTDYDDFDFRNSTYGHELCYSILSGFIKQKNIFTSSEKFNYKCAEYREKLFLSCLEYFKTNDAFTGCYLLDKNNGFYFFIRPCENDESINVSVAIFTEQFGDLRFILDFADILYVKDGLHFNGMSKYISELTMPCLLTAIDICGYSNNPSIIPHKFIGSSNKSKEPEIGDSIITEQYGVKITYITTASFKNRTYRILESKVSSHSRKMRCGPGRLMIKNIEIKQHKRIYKNKEVSV